MQSMLLVNCVIKLLKQICQDTFDFSLLLLQLHFMKCAQPICFLYYFFQGNHFNGLLSARCISYHVQSDVIHCSSSLIPIELIFKQCFVIQRDITMIYSY